MTNEASSPMKAAPPEKGWGNGVCPPAKVGWPEESREKWTASPGAISANESEFPGEACLTEEKQ